jgi:effector-binding domain-containing protein
MLSEHKSPDVEILQLPPQPVISIRATIQVAQLGEAMGDRLSALISYIQQQGATPAGPPYVRYHTFGDLETDMETGIPLAAPIPGQGPILAGELPAGSAVSTWHYGSHDRLGDAYARISAWLKANGRDPDGPTWEVYHWIDPNQPLDPASWDPSTWGTRLIQPLK